MQTITSMEQIDGLKDNQIIGNFNFTNSKVVFHGEGNVLITKNTEASAKTVLSNTTIIFHNDNNVVFLDESRRSYSIGLEMYNNSFCNIGAHNYFNGKLSLQCSEQCNIFIADECMFSFGVWIRTSDVHLIYDIESRKRLNCSKSVFIGDHVWVGQDAKAWRGTQIGSGAIFGASAFSAGKRIPSNTAWGGSPARLIRRGVCFFGNASHTFTDVETEKFGEYSGDKYVYQFDENESLDFLELEQKIKSRAAARERAEFLLDFSNRKSKNRFYIGES